MITTTAFQPIFRPWTPHYQGFETSEFYEVGIAAPHPTLNQLEAHLI
jgi:NCAIR mutase (PurE)-related protein